ncbi:MAG TPA: NfeD family protein [Acidimicrobiales bacterium]|nr:NfeD family protein [Acidimicrobiales bacterium]
MARVIAGLMMTLVLGAWPAAAAQPAPKVLVTTVDDAITPVIADHIADGIGRAERGGYAAYLVHLDTPGGLDSSMRKIVQRILSASVPVVVYVSPQGARAASAGAVIALAAHVSAVAPGTAIGAATPIDLEGGDLERKVVNDAAAYTESLARLRGRDIGFARDIVLEGRSVSADDAVRIRAVDFLAATLDDVLRQADGRQVKLGDQSTVTARTAGATTDEREMGLFRRIQQRLADPNLTFLFLSIGTLALMYELASPGIMGAGTVGVIFMLLGFFGVAVLPVNVVGLLLLLAAVVLFALELFAPGIGVAAAGGSVALALSGVFLFDDAPGLELSAAVFVPVAAVVGGGVVVAGRFARRSITAPSTMTGAERFLGQQVTVGPRGQAFVDGAWWQLRSTTELHEGATARVVDVDGLVLVVEQESET